MVVGVIPGIRRVAAGDDALCATMAQPGCIHGVFAVIAARALWQLALAVAEGAAVLAMRVGPAALDQCDGLACLGRQEGW